MELQTSASSSVAWKNQARDESWTATRRRLTAFLESLTVFQTHEESELLRWTQNSSFQLKGSQQKIVDSRFWVSGFSEVVRFKTIHPFFFFTCLWRLPHRECPTRQLTAPLCARGTDATPFSSVRLLKSHPHSRLSQRHGEQCGLWCYVQNSQRISVLTTSAVKPKKKKKRTPNYRFSKDGIYSLIRGGKVPELIICAIGSALRHGHCLINDGGQR